MKVYIPAVHPHGIPKTNYIVRPLLDPQDELKEKFPNYFRVATQLLTPTSLEACEAIIYPHWWRSGIKDDRYTKISALAKRHGKPLIVLSIEDFPVSRPKNPAKTPGILTFKPSLYASVLGPNEHAIPALRRDILKEAEAYKLQTKYRPKQKGGPAIGFCGQSASAGVRVEVLNRFTASGLNTKFILQGTFWGGARRRDIIQKTAKYHTARKAYLKNILGTDFTVCVRGAGNWSIRFYECLSLGRVPILIDTDCVLPFPNKIDWDSLLIIIPRGKLKQAESIVRSRCKIADKQFIQWQKDCRAVWLEYLSLEGFCKHMRQVKCKLR